MSHLRHWAALAALLAASSVRAADAPARPAEVVAFLHDGSTVRKAVLRDDVEITTRFGKLRVPVAEVRRIEFGLHLPEGVARQVEAAVKQLGSDQYKQREAAGKQLVALGFRAYPAVLAATRSPDKEVASRARAAAEQIRKEAPAELLALPAQDVVYTRDCVLAGRIEASALKAQTASLGELSLRLGELRSVRSAAVDQTQVAVDAAQFAKDRGKWVDSGVTVEPGVGLDVTASGRVDLVPAQAGQHVSGPEGYPNAGTVAVVAPGGARHYLPGTLLGRIGETGEVFVIGRGHQRHTRQGGKLYLHIVPLAAGNGSTGSYQVKVRTGPGVEVTQSPAPPAPVGRVTSYGGTAGSSTGGYGVPAGTPPPPVPAVAPPPAPAGGFAR